MKRRNASNGANQNFSEQDNNNLAAQRQRLLQALRSNGNAGVTTQTGKNCLAIKAPSARIDSAGRLPQAAKLGARFDQTCTQKSFTQHPTKRITNEAII